MQAAKGGGVIDRCGGWHPAIHPSGRHRVVVITRESG
jgi:hypothetical protein